jgi:hypothetical protein
VDGKKIGEVCPGPLSVRLRELLMRVESGDDAAFDHWLTYVQEEG